MMATYLDIHIPGMKTADILRAHEADVRGRPRTAWTTIATLPPASIRRRTGSLLTRCMKSKVRER